MTGYPCTHAFHITCYVLCSRYSHMNLALCMLSCSVVPHGNSCTCSTSYNIANQQSFQHFICHWLVVMYSGWSPCNGLAVWTISVVSCHSHRHQTNYWGLYFIFDKRGMPWILYCYLYLVIYFDILK